MNSNTETHDARTELTNADDVAALDEGDEVRVVYESKYADRGNEQELVGTVESARFTLTPEDHDGYAMVTLDVATDDGERRVEIDATPEGTPSVTVKAPRRAHDSFTADRSKVTNRTSTHSRISRPARGSVYVADEDDESEQVETDGGEDDDERELDDATRGDRVAVTYESVHADEPQTVEGTLIYRDDEPQFGERFALSGDDENDEWGLRVGDDGEATLHKRLLVAEGRVGGRSKYKTSRVSTPRGVLDVAVTEGELDREASPFYEGDRVALPDGTEGDVFRVRTVEETGAVGLDEDVPEGATVTSEGSSAKAWSRDKVLVDVLDDDGERHYANEVEDVSLVEDEQGGDEDDEDERRREQARENEPSLAVNDPENVDAATAPFTAMDASALDVFAVEVGGSRYVTSTMRVGEDGYGGLDPAGSGERVEFAVEDLERVEWYGPLDDE